MLNRNLENISLPYISREDKHLNNACFNPDPLGSKNITIHYPGAIFGTFLIFNI